MIQLLEAVILSYSNQDGSGRSVLLKLEQAADSILQYQLRFYANLHLGSLFTLAGDRRKASHLFNQALGYAEHIANERSQSMALDELCWHLVRVGRFLESLRIAGRIQTEINKSNALAHIASAYAERGKLDRALQVVSKITLAGQKETPLRCVAIAYARSGRLERSHQILDQISNDWDRDMVFAELVTAYLKVGNLDAARKAADQIKDITPAELKASALAEIATAEMLQACSTKTRTGVSK
jgi:tetratricopeptide (TPR) repeat protein